MQLYLVHLLKQLKRVSVDRIVPGCVLSMALQCTSTGPGWIQSLHNMCTSNTTGTLFWLLRSTCCHEIIVPVTARSKLSREWQPLWVFLDLIVAPAHTSRFWGTAEHKHSVVTTTGLVAKEVDGPLHPSDTRMHTHSGSRQDEAKKRAEQGDWNMTKPLRLQVKRIFWIES